MENASQRIFKDLAKLLKAALLVYLTQSQKRLSAALAGINT